LGVSKLAIIAWRNYGPTPKAKGGQYK